MDEISSRTAPTTPFRASCAALGIHPNTGYEMVRRGEFPVQVIKLGPGKWVCPTRALQRLLDL